jgi:hypothetical protein
MQKNPDYGHRLPEASVAGRAYLWLSRDITSEIQRILPSASITSISVRYAGSFGGAQNVF